MHRRNLFHALIVGVLALIMPVVPRSTLIHEGVTTKDIDELVEIMRDPRRRAFDRYMAADAILQLAHERS